MLSLTPSLRLVTGLQCPNCGQLLVQSGREDEYAYCPECGYSLPSREPESTTSSIDSF